MYTRQNLQDGYRREARALSALAKQQDTSRKQEEMKRVWADRAGFY
jgi:hypothetical protein